MTIYRVITKTTGSLQPGGGGATFWNREVIYCGTDRDEARVVYHTSTVEDFGGSYGNRCRETICEEIADAETEDFADDEVTATEL